MSLPEDSSFVSEKFSGVARLFPLPNLVMFPHVMQPLHIFEPRYRSMLEAALVDDGLIAMAVLAPGWEKDYEGRPKIQSTACLCKIATHHRTDDGNYNVLIVGLKRIEIVAEMPPLKPFREAQVRLHHDDHADESNDKRSARQRELFERFKRILPPSSNADEQFDQLLGKHVSLGMLTDLVAYTLDVGTEVKLALLAEANVDRRVELLLASIAELEQGQGSRVSFPPDFSVN